MAPERRVVTAKAFPVRLETREVGGKTQNVCTGYAAVFYDAGNPGTEYELYPGLRERIMPTAFDRVLREGQDVRGLFNHDANWILGRCSAGTMRLSVDKVGLKYEIDLPDTQAGRDSAESMRRGDVTGSSFSFLTKVQKFMQVDLPNGQPDDIRELHDVDVMDVGPVVFPAYEATSALMRAGELPAEVRSAWQEARCKCQGGSRGAVRYHHDPERVIDGPWDADAALGRCRSWASSGDSMDHGKLSRAFAYTAADGTEAGHRLLHHDVRDGKLCVHMGGVRECLRQMDQEGYDGVPGDDMKAVRSHLQRHADAMEEYGNGTGDHDDDDDDRARPASAELRRMRLRLAEACQ